MDCQVTFNRTPFDIISNLIPLADDICHLKAVCRENGNDAAYSTLNITAPNDSIELIGGLDIYSATDRTTYFKDKDYDKHYCELLTEFIKLYVSDMHICKDIINTVVVDGLNNDLKSKQFMEIIKHFMKN